MRLVINADGLDLADRGDFGSFAAVTALPTDRLEAVITQLGVGRLDPDGQHVWVRPGVIEAAAGADRSAAWNEGFATMCAYAESHGWTDDEGRIRAHIVAD